LSAAHFLQSLRDFCARRLVENHLVTLLGMMLIGCCVQMPREPRIKLRSQKLTHVEHHQDMYGQRRAVQQPQVRLNCAQPALRLEVDGAGSDRDFGGHLDSDSDGDRDQNQAGTSYSIRHQRPLRAPDDDLRSMFMDTEYAAAVQPIWASQNKGIMLMSAPIHDPVSGTKGMFAKEALHLPSTCAAKACVEALFWL
jgi:hypothetical protein